MCGISIIIDRENSPVNQEHIRMMNEKVVHRGPDDEGYFFHSCFAFGHRRLSIIDTSRAGQQPMQKEGKWIVYNGMLYNYIELRNELIAAGHVFNSYTDTEVILVAYMEWGVAAFEKFNGMWALAIYDEATQSVILCRDHFGIKPLYYTLSGNLFLAGSEIKQFTVFPAFKPIINSPVAMNFLLEGRLNYSDETFFSGVKSLPAGHYLQYKLKGHHTELHEWYNLQKSVDRQAANTETPVDKVRSLFQSSVSLCMRADVTVGACLSGGIDSSSIVTTIQQQQSANRYFSTFTSCYHNKQYDEQEYSDLITAQTGFASVKVFPDLQQLFTEGYFDRMLYYQDQPFSSASHYSEFNVFKAAAEQHVKVMLDGQGSDEYFCGYPEFFLIRIREYLRQGALTKAIRLIRAKGKHGKGSFIVLKEMVNNWYVYPLLARVKKISGKLQYPWLNPAFREMAKTVFITPKHKNIRQLSIDQVTSSSIPYQLHSEDRNAMLFSIESRLPFLDHRLVEYVIGLPSDYKINRGYSKYVLRESLPELPEPVRWRKDKIGFAAPDKEWILENHVQIRKELELAIDSTPFFCVELLNRFDRFVQGKRGYEPCYFRVMAFSRFCRIFNMQFVQGV